MRLMKTLRELKYDLLFEQQLYRKYLDDYKKIEDGEEIVKAIKDAVLVKEPGHKINLDDFERPQRAMHAIGG